MCRAQLSYGVADCVSASVRLPLSFVLNATLSGGGAALSPGTVHLDTWFRTPQMSGADTKKGFAFGSKGRGGGGWRRSLHTLPDSFSSGRGRLD